MTLIEYDRTNKIPTLDFISNYKNELFDNIVSENLEKYAKDNNIRLVFSMLEDTLPNNLRNNIILQLNQAEKVFKI